MGNHRYQDNRYNRRRYGERHRSKDVPLWAKIVAGGTILAGFLAFESTLPLSAATSKPI
ncbi:MULTISPECIES: hypothetical protein [unclassified Mesorhizobium]|uniref:hypothetical protein n=1 Tax=unclassified Mesorhizobium TaxID=325217 RepID=UPI00333B81FF